MAAVFHASLLRRRRSCSPCLLPKFSATPLITLITPHKDATAALFCVPCHRTHLNHDLPQQLLVVLVVHQELVEALPNGRVNRAVVLRTAGGEGNVSIAAQSKRDLPNSIFSFKV